MKPINLIISTFIVVQGLLPIANGKAMTVIDSSANQVESAQKSFQANNPSTSKYIRPKTADNGSPFPKKSGYIKGYPIQFKQGYSTLTVDNSKNSSDVFVKLYALDAVPPQPVRVFFIRKGDKFTATNIKPGSYDVRYRDLNYGGLSRTETFNLAESKDFDGGTRFERMTMTLYKVPGGTMKTYPLSEQEF